MMKRKILFGAGKIGDTAYELFDEGQVAYYVDNNADNVVYGSICRQQTDDKD